MRKYLFVFLALCLVLPFSACDAPNTASETEDISPRTSFYSISTNEDLTYSYQIVDKNGNIVGMATQRTKECFSLERGWAEQNADEYAVALCEVAQKLKNLRIFEDENETEFDEVIFPSLMSCSVNFVIRISFSIYLPLS